MYKEVYHGYDTFLIESKDELAHIYDLCRNGVNVGLSIRTSGGDYGEDDIVGISISCGKSYDDYSSFYIPICHELANNIDKEESLRLIKYILNNNNVVFWDRNYEFSFFEKNGIVVPFVGHTYDAQCALYLASSEPRPSLASYSKSILGIDIHEYVENENIDYTKSDPYVCFKYIAIKPILTVILCKTLFEKYPYIKKIYSLDNKSIEAVRRLSKEKIYFDESIVDKKLQDETLSDEIKNFLNRLKSERSPFRSHYSAVNVPTGRISSGKVYGNKYYAQLNIQSCPKEIRNVFVAPEGWNWMCFDYDSQEMCLMANMSNEENLLKPIEKGEDVHEYLAKEMFNDISREEVKEINFSSNYGASLYTISQKLKKTKEETEKIMDKYYTVLSSLSRWEKNLIESARKLGVSFTYFGRPRVLTKYYNSLEFKDRSYADRCAVNSPIQGCVPLCSYIELDDKVVALDTILGQRITCKDRALLPSRRGDEEPFAVRFGRKDFMVCDINHKFITGSLKRPRYATLKDGKPFRALFSKLHKKMIPEISLLREYSSDDMICYIKLCMRKYKEIGRNDKKLNAAFWKLAMTRARFELTNIEMCKIKSLGSLYGFNVCCNRNIDKFHIEFTRKRSGVLRMFRSMLEEKYSEGVKDLVPMKVAVGTCSVISKDDVQMYPSFGVWNKNTGGDILRMDLIKLYELIESDKEFCENVKPVLTVHDEIDFYVRNGYEKEAERKIKGIMCFKPQGFRTNVNVSCSIGRSWAECK